MTRSNVVLRLAAAVVMLGGAFGTTAVAQNGEPIPISACGAIRAPGHYILVTDLVCPASGIQIRSDEVKFHLDGHTIRGNGVGVGIALGWGVKGGVTRVHVQGPGVVTNFAENMKLQETTDSTVRGVTLTDARSHGLTIQLSFQTGDLVPSSRNKFNDNVITGSAGSGISINGGYDNVFRGNLLERNGQHGLVIMDGDRNDLRGNTAASNGRDGFTTSASADQNIIRGNTSQANFRFDLNDQHGHCQANSWQGNTFNTANPGCIK